MSYRFPVFRYFIPALIIPRQRYSFFDIGDSPPVFVRVIFLFDQLLLAYYLIIIF
jgi:hypothetical protein